MDRICLRRRVLTPGPDEDVSHWTFNFATIARPGIVSQESGALRSFSPIPIVNDARSLPCHRSRLRHARRASVHSSSPAPPPPPRAPPGPPELQPRETFDWTGEKISFSIPPVGWRREGETSGGIKGTRFVKERSVGEGIGLGDYYILADRNRSAHIREILAKFHTFDYGFAWDKALRKAYAYTDTPFSSLESEIAERVNTEVSQAGAAWRTRDRDAAKAHLEAALAEASRLSFSLDDVITRVEFTPERRQNPEWYRLLGRRETTIAGEPAVIVDYTVKVPERLQHLRGP